MAAINFQQTFYRCAHTGSKRLFVNKLRWNISTRAFSNSDQEYHNLKTEEESFEQMLRNSQFVKLGRPRGKTVSGRIVHISGADNDDLYVDFGWKLHAVVKRPSSKKGRKENSGDDDQSPNLQRQMMKDLSMQAAVRARQRLSDNEDNSAEESSNEEESKTKKRLGKKRKQKKKAKKMNKAAYQVEDLDKTEDRKLFSSFQKPLKAESTSAPTREILRSDFQIPLPVPKRFDENRFDNILSPRQ